MDLSLPSDRSEDTSCSGRKGSGNKGNAAHGSCYAAHYGHQAPANCFDAYFILATDSTGWFRAFVAFSSLLIQGKAVVFDLIASFGQKTPR